MKEIKNNYKKFILENKFPAIEGSYDSDSISNYAKKIPSFISLSESENEESENNDNNIINHDKNDDDEDDQGNDDHNIKSLNKKMNVKSKNKTSKMETSKKGEHFGNNGRNKNKNAIFFNNSVSELISNKNNNIIFFGYYSPFKEENIMNNLDLDLKEINNSLKFLSLESSSKFKIEYFKDRYKFKEKIRKNKLNDILFIKRFNENI